jgi:3-dehydroquinate dehydratase / shikimate dehydrogenase
MKRTASHVKFWGRGLGRLCAVVAAEEALAMRRQLLLALRQTPTVELRLDWLKNDRQRTMFLNWLGKGRSRNRRFSRATLIATCRRIEGGGRLHGDAQAELSWLAAARAAGCQWCDLEIETVRRLPGKSLRAAQDGALPPAILLSLHDFVKTPAKLPDLSTTLRTTPQPQDSPAAIKIAAHAKRLADGLRLLRYARRAENIVAVPMGEVGLPLRILALRAGSALAYAPIAEATAPGQVSLRDMKELYRAHLLNRASKIYGVIGDPIAHSLSPLMHNTGYIARGLNAVFLPFLVHALPDFLAAIGDVGLRGFSVTLPHKQSILRHLKTCDPLAADIGAVNTVLVKPDGSLHGYNTDYLGVLRALEPHMKLRDSRVLIFGAGGSGRAAAFALARAGAHVAICARRPAAARELAKACGGESIPQRALRTETFDAILNATPVGMHPNTSISPLDSRELHCRVVMDLIYRPLRTKLLQIAAQQGIAAISGVEMFVAQGAAQWELFTRTPAPEKQMRAVVLRALQAAEVFRAQGGSSPSAKNARGRV